MGIVLIWLAVWIGYQEPTVDRTNAWLWTLFAAVALDLWLGLRDGRPGIRVRVKK